GVPRRARVGVGFPVAAVSPARVQARPQGPGGAVAFHASPRVLPRAEARARAPRSLRRVSALSIPRRPSRPRGARRARLDSTLRASSRSRRGVADDLPASRSVLGRVRGLGTARGYRDQLPVLALP